MANLQTGNTPPRGALAARFITAPFSVLDTRTGWWRERRRHWAERGITPGATGRGEQLIFSGSSQPMAVVRAKNAWEAQTGTPGTWEAFFQANPNLPGALKGTSIFDPVVAELMYRWFSPHGGIVLDPFAGGSVRGIVAALTGRRYVGIDLRQEQINANLADWAGIGPGHAAPRWIAGDSDQLPALFDEEVDFVFSCPPYGDLERYSDNPADLSTMTYQQFRQVYGRIIGHALARLRQDRFAAFVVSDIRDRRGIYRQFVGHTIAAFEAAGARLYNEAVLINHTATLAFRAGRMFASTRKLGRHHQCVLVFVKGDPRRAARACGGSEVL